MGRPLNKRNFGPPTAGGNEIKVQFHNGTGSVNGWIVKQKGSKRFLCSDGSVEALCTIVDKASASLLEGEMSITVLDDSTTPRQVVKIAANKATVDTGESIGWTYDNSSVDGYVEMEEAGEPAAVIAATAMIAATVYTIITTGTTDFTLVGAADSEPGTIFTASGAGTGTGTVQATVAVSSDNFEGD